MAGSEPQPFELCSVDRLMASKALEWHGYHATVTYGIDSEAENCPSLCRVERSYSGIVVGSENEVEGMEVICRFASR